MRAQRLAEDESIFVAIGLRRCEDKCILRLLICWNEVKLMALLLREDDVQRLLPMKDAMAAVEEVMRQHGRGVATNNLRGRTRTPKGTLHLMAAAAPQRGYFGFKAYATFSSRERTPCRSSGRTQFHVMLYSAETGALLSLIEASALGQIRTGAASGVATQYMAREDAKTVGLFGTGYQARTQIAAVCAARPIQNVKVYSRNAERCRAFAREMSESLGVAMQPAETPEETVRDSDVVITITTAREPVFDGRHLPQGVHVNAAGANFLMKREVDEETVRRAHVVVVDDKEQAKIECGDLLAPIERGVIAWERVRTLGEIVAGITPGRTSPADVTLFESHGIALWDVAVAAHVYERAKAEGAGETVRL
jgi:ornithine cyclodeaminase/alanine dehydrogenase-like protein (mu-crystallin family)